MPPDPLLRPQALEGRDQAPLTPNAQPGCTVCYWAGAEYSSGSFVCVTDPMWPDPRKFVCQNGTWIEQGFCFGPPQP